MGKDRKKSSESRVSEKSENEEFSYRGGAREPVDFVFGDYP